MKKTISLTLILLLSLYLTACEKKDTPQTQTPPSDTNVININSVPPYTNIINVNLTPQHQEEVKCRECQYKENDKFYNYSYCKNKDCNDNIENTIDTCLYPQTKNAKCENKQTKKYCDSSKCAADEICINEKCTKAPLTLVFINGGFSNDEFENTVQKDVKTLADATPLKECPEQIKVLTPNLCCPENTDIAECAKKQYPIFDSAILIHPTGTFVAGCSAISSQSNSIIVTDCSKAFVHEIGHSVFGFKDKYCYSQEFSAEYKNTPCGYSQTKREYACPLPGTCWNRVTHETDRLTGLSCHSNQDCADKYNDPNYECVSCFIPKENSWDWNYCSQFNNPPIYCLGNPNMHGTDREVMATAQYLEKTAFSTDEYSIIEKRLKCLE